MYFLTQILAGLLLSKGWPDGIIPFSWAQECDIIRYIRSYYDPPAGYIEALIQLFSNIPPDNCIDLHIRRKVAPQSCAADHGD